MISGFRIAARALRQLGAELITSDDVALNELIKNAFDAKSPRVKVAIYAPIDAASIELIEEKLASAKSPIPIPQAREEFSKSFDKELAISEKDDLLSEFDELAHSRDELVEFLKNLRTKRYFIRIEDTGKGMSKDELTDSFLVIGTPNKYLLKKANENANLLGEKGVGRLSMMRLGKQSTVYSKIAGQNKWHRIRFNWSLFDNPDLYLEDINIPVETDKEDDDLAVKGTYIVIKDLYANWNGSKVDTFIKKYIRRLQGMGTILKCPFSFSALRNSHN